jgi:peroxiredoxin Q/BCP
METTTLQGKKAPEFKATGQDGKAYTLKDFKGQWVILFFYPKADTPG